MKYFSFLSVFLSFVFLSKSSEAQVDTLYGRVYAFKGYALNEVFIKTKKSKQITYSDSLGLFKIAYSDNDKVSFSAEGFMPYSVRIKGVDSLHNLKVNMLYEDYNNSFRKVLDAGHMNEQALDYCVNHLMFSNNNYELMESIWDVIIYENSGARFIDVNGTVKVVLTSRGPNTIAGSPEALLVVDGIVVDDISNIRPFEVKAIRILEGNNAAHWGSRGGNGVIEIDLVRRQ